MRSGFFGRSGFGEHPAILVVDMTLGFTDSSSPLACDLDETVAAIGNLLDVARRKHVPIAFTTVSYSKRDQSTAASFFKKIPALKGLESDSRWTEVDPRIEPAPDEPVINKLFASAFFGTSLISTLVSRGTDTVIVTGASTSGCVRATVVDALQHGFDVIVPKEAVGDRNHSAHEANLSDMDAKYADVLSLEEVIARLEALPIIATS